jgi:hypothetical protein
MKEDATQSLANFISALKKELIQEIVTEVTKSLLEQIQQSSGSNTSDSVLLTTDDVAALLLKSIDLGGGK